MVFLQKSHPGGAGTAVPCELRKLLMPDRDNGVAPGAALALPCRGSDPCGILHAVTAALVPELAATG